jgi:hypothetical protein
MSTYIGPEEMIFNNDLNQGINSGGFSVNSMMMKFGFSPIMTLNNNYQKGGDKTVSNIFNNLVVPNWSFSSSGGSKKHDLN